MLYVLVSESLSALLGGDIIPYGVGSLQGAVTIHVQAEPSACRSDLINRDSKNKLGQLLQGYL
jgi:hypothetical protein